jgi:DNA-binding XRE family transcriptional regulator
MVPVAARLLRTWRRVADKTQGWCADELGVAQPTWSEYENGRKTPRTKHALKLVVMTCGAVPIEAWGQMETEEQALAADSDAAAPPAEVDHDELTPPKGTRVIDESESQDPPGRSRSSTPAEQH